MDHAGMGSIMKQQVALARHTGMRCCSSSVYKTPMSCKLISWRTQTDAHTSYKKRMAACTARKKSESDSGKDGVSDGEAFRKLRVQMEKLQQSQQNESLRIEAEGASPVRSARQRGRSGGQFQEGRDGSEDVENEMFQKLQHQMDKDLWQETVDSMPIDVTYVQAKKQLEDERRQRRIITTALTVGTGAILTYTGLVYGEQVSGMYSTAVQGLTEFAVMHTM
mmetsp:Transcript_18044/g.34459  ORF Transcript_18044/g.34459 Transcript_18044/m.34459 type:complete len:222 (+) Transcript_18044:62-727(+)